jgi:hypothetical protein
MGYSQPLDVTNRRLVPSQKLIFLKISFHRKKERGSFVRQRPRLVAPASSRFWSLEIASLGFKSVSLAAFQSRLERKLRVPVNLLKNGRGCPISLHVHG